MKIRRNLIRTIPIFSELSDLQIDQLLAQTRKLHYPKGSVVLNEGDPGDYMLIILKGGVKVVLFGERGQEMLLYKLGSGDFFGELALVDQAPRSATVITVEETDFLQLVAKEFQALIQKDHVLCDKILRHLSGRVRDLTEQIRTLSMFDVYGRLVRCFIRLARQSVKKHDSPVFIEDPPSQQELANMIGCSRETVSRAMKVLLGNGYLKDTKGKLRIEDRALKEYGQSE